MRVDGRLVSPTELVMKEWGKLCGQQELKGKRLPVLDSIVAATAITQGHTLVSRNTKDYSSAVRLSNLWEY